jgi:prevent-host-death family protein
MVHEVGSFEAKTRLAELLRLAERGDEIVILRRGIRVAVIVGSARYEALTSADGDDGADWVESTRAYIDRSPRISRAEFEEIMRESKEGRA